MNKRDFENRIKVLEAMVGVLCKVLSNHFCAYDYTQQSFDTFREMAEWEAANLLYGKDKEDN